MIVIGLTGSIGMGKSTTAALFAENGIPVFDADAAVHRLYAGRAVGPVEAAFANVSRDGVIDREALASQVMHDPAAMKRLEAIIHPLVREERRAFLDRAKRDGARIVVLDIPLLFETGGVSDVDVVVLASAPPDVQRARVLARPGMSEARLDAIRAKQMPDTEKRTKSHVIIETGRGIDDARRQVRELICRLDTSAC